MTTTRSGVLDFGETIRTALPPSCKVSDRECAVLEKHFNLLSVWNRRMNLTSIRDPLEVIKRHYCESVFLATNLPEGDISVVDVGSGAGFPGIGVAVMRPGADVTLVEANQRKAAFLKESTRDLENVRVWCRRAEGIAERFDWLVSRAVAWEDLPLISGHLALLASDPAPDFPWRERIRLPWGERRILLIGDVPRETQKLEK